jgi:murein DD-endopeptidase MepM/ murein hydrolase activator NlpD
MIDLFPVDYFYLYGQKKAANLNNAIGCFGFGQIYPVAAQQALGFVIHNGHDFTIDDGQNIKTVQDGICHKTIEELTAPNGTRGRGITIRSKDPDELGRYLATVYWHLKDFWILEGEEVKVGQVIATGDNTGYSTGTHLHFGAKYYDYAFSTLNSNNGYGGYFNPLALYTMRYVIVPDGTQYMLDETLKVAYGISDIDDLSSLQKQGLFGAPEKLLNINSYIEKSAVTKSRLAEPLKKLADLLNIKI